MVMDNMAGKFKFVTSKMITTVCDAWELQKINNICMDLNINTCKGMTQSEIDITIAWFKEVAE